MDVAHMDSAHASDVSGSEIAVDLSNPTDPRRTADAADSDSRRAPPRESSESEREQAKDPREDDPKATVDPKGEATPVGRN